MQCIDSAGTVRTINASVVGKKYIALSYANGGTPELFLNGASAGNFTGVISLAQTATDTMYVGNTRAALSPINNLVKCCLLISRQLTATEHADLYAELEAMSWPTKKYIRTTTKNKPTGKEQGLIWAPDLTLPSINSTLIDLSPTNSNATSVLTLPTYQMDNVGPGYRFHGTHYFTASGASFTARSGFTALAVIRPNNVVGVHAIVGQAGRWALYTTATSFGLITLGIKAYTTAANILGIGKPIHVSAVFKADYSVDLYANGQFVVNVAHNAPANVGSGAFCVGYNAATVPWFNGTIYRAEIYNRELSAAEIYQNYQATGLTRTGFETSWGVPCLGAAVGGTVGQNISTLCRTTVNTSTGIITTDTIEGVPVKVLKQVGVSSLTSNIPAYVSAHVGADNAYGQWQWWLNHADASTTDVMFCATGTTTGAGVYRLRVSNTEVLSLIYQNVTVVATTGAGYIVPGQWVRYRVTRDYAGNFKVWIKPEYGVEVLALSQNHTTGVAGAHQNYIFNAGDKISLGGLVPGYGIEHRLFA
jgi:hypothetical protein